MSVAPSYQMAVSDHVIPHKTTPTNLFVSPKSSSRRFQIMCD